MTFVPREGEVYTRGGEKCGHHRRASSRPIRVLDHLIFGDARYDSFAEKGGLSSGHPFSFLPNSEFAREAFTSNCFAIHPRKPLEYEVCIHPTPDHLRVTVVNDATACGSCLCPLKPSVISGYVANRKREPWRVIMKNYLGEIIYKARLALDLTQDQYGNKYEISGPAVFKFEKGYVRPSLKLWVRMALDAGLTEHRAVLLWMKTKLPEQYQDYVELQGALAVENRHKKKQSDYSVPKGRDAIVAMAAKDVSLPAGLRDLIADPELWALFKPTGAEINQLRDIFGPLGAAGKNQYREALRLLREFREG